MKERLKAGYCPRRQSFGYRSGTKQDPDIKKKYPNENAHHVKEMFELYDTGAYSYRSLAKHFRNKGVKMQKDRVEKILSNPFYYGVIKWNHRRENKVCYYLGNHEPIIHKDLFVRVEQRRLKRTRNRGYKFSRNPYAKFLQCECGKLLYWEQPSNGSKKKKHAYFRCHNKACSFTSIRADKFETRLIEELSSFQVRLKWFSAFKESNKKYSLVDTSKEDTLSQLNFELNTINGRMDKLNEGFLLGVFSVDEVKKKKTNLGKRKQDILVEIESLKNKKKVRKSVTAKRLFELFKNLANQYLQGDLPLKKQILELCFSNGVIIDGNPVFKPTSAVCKVASLPKTQFGWNFETSLVPKVEEILSGFHTEDIVRKVENLERLTSEN